MESVSEGLEEQERAVAMFVALPDIETHWYTTHRAQFAPSSSPPIKAFRARLILTQAVVGRFADLDAESDPQSRVYHDLYAHMIHGAVRGQPEEARSCIEHVLARTRAAGDYQNLGAALAHQLEYVGIPYYADHAAEIDRIAGAAIAAWEHVGEATLGLPSRTVGLAAFSLHGQWDEAWSLLPATRRFSSRSIFGEMFGVPIGLIRGRGDTDLAWTIVREMFPAGPGTEPGHLPFRRALAVQETAVALSLDGGDLARARTWLEAHDRWLTWNGAVAGQSEGHMLWAEYYRYAGDPTRAQEHAGCARAHAAAPRQPLALIAAHRLLGELATESGRIDDATRHLDVSLQLADACAAPYERALTLLARAELLAAMDDHAGAIVLLDAVRTICLSLGAQPTLARTDALAARLTATREIASHYPAGLSAREVEVLRLLVQGMSNRAIAERLFVSVRTVERHIGNLYTKIGAHNRADATSFAFRHDLT
jgi:DNA-binding CsgD family transcriptional regulator